MKEIKKNIKVELEQIMNELKILDYIYEINDKYNWSEEPINLEWLKKLDLTYFNLVKKFIDLLKLRR